MVIFFLIFCLENELENLLNVAMIQLFYSERHVWWSVILQLTIIRTFLIARWLQIHSTL